MCCNKNFKLLLCMLVLAAMLFSPLHLFAQGEDTSLKHEAGFYYTVHKGDTLWDLSKRFSDSPWLWPDLWKENSQISNPHRIYPGERIRLFHISGIKHFAPRTEEKKTVSKNNISNELPKERPFYYYSAINSIGFIKKEPVKPSGVIFKVKDAKIMIGQGDLVYIRQMGDIPFMTGTRYTIYRTLKPNPHKREKAFTGMQYYMTGVLEITKNEPSFAEARVVKSFREIQLNDLLMPYHRKSTKIPLVKSKKGLNGKLITSEEHDSIIGDHAVAFIDKGSKDGVKPGQMYNIYYQEKEKIEPGSKESVLMPHVVYGAVLVLYTEPTTSTVLVTQSDQSILPGATIKSPMD